MSGQCVVGVQRLNFVGDDFHLFLSGLIRSHVFVILLSLSSPNSELPVIVIHAVCFWVGRAPRLSLLASANGCERDLVEKSLSRLFVHPLDAFRVWIRVGSFFVKIDFDGFRGAVELFLHVGAVSVTCLKSKIWPKKNHDFFGQI